MRLPLGLLIGTSLILVTALVELSLGPEVSAASFVVTTTADSGGGSLRQALIDAAASPGEDVVTFDPSVFPEGNPATITAADAYTIEGAAAAQPLTIDGTGAGVIIQGQQATDSEALLYFQRAGAISGITLRNIRLQGSLAQSDIGGEGIEFSATEISNVEIDSITVNGTDGNGVQIKATESISNLTVSNSEINDSGFHGLFIGAPNMANIAVTGSEMSSNDAHGLELKGDAMDEVSVTDNVISDNEASGVFLAVTDSPEPATADVTSNEITGNGEDAIHVEASANTPHVTISQNTTTNNGGLGINLEGGNQDQFGVTDNDAGDGDAGPNDLLNFPEWNAGAGYTEVVGAACANCLVEIYLADDDPSGHGEGETYLSGIVVDEFGVFTFPLCGLSQGDLITGTATDADGNTSEFSENYEVLENEPPCTTPTPSPTPTPAGETVVWADDNCSGQVDPIDSLLTLRHDAGLSVNTGDCPAFGTNVSIVASVLLWGDIDCSEAIDPIDSLKILRFDAGLSVAQGAGCPAMGSEVTIAVD